MPSPELLNPIPRLTERQLEVLRLVAKAKSNWTIARLLKLTEDTVKKHLYNIFRILGVYSRMEAANLLREWEGTGGN